MATMRAIPEFEGFRVIHPLKDEAEQKCSTEGLGHIAMSTTVRISLAVLRGYLILVTLILGYHVLDLAGVFRQIH